MLRSNRPLLFQITLSSLIGMSINLTTLAAANDKSKPSSSCEKVRASFDVGSSSTKMKVLKIDICKGKILETLYPKTKEEEDLARVNIPFMKDLIQHTQDAEKDTSIPEESVPSFSRTLWIAEVEFSKLKKQAEPFKPQDYIGVATEAFRRAKNSDYIVNYVLNRKLGIKIYIPQPSQEALIEWMGASATFKDINDVEPRMIITFGISDESMQIGAKTQGGNFTAFTSRLASDNMLSYALEKVDRDAKTFLPLSRPEIESLIEAASREATGADQELKDKMSELEVVVLGLGGVINKSVNSTLVSLIPGSENRKYFTISDMTEAIYHLADKGYSDSIFEKVPEEFRNNVPANMALVLGVMKALGIEKVYYSKVDNTYGAPFLKNFAIKIPVPKPKPKVIKKPVVVAPTETPVSKYRFRFLD
jgi:hypothetical protein